MAAHAFNPRIWSQRQVDLYKFKVAYIVSPVQPLLYRETLFQTNREREREREREGGKEGRREGKEERERGGREGEEEERRERRKEKKNAYFLGLGD